MLAELPEQFLGYYVVDPLLKWLAKAVFSSLGSEQSLNHVLQETQH